ncbi:GNAT family N-acetyltransferase [Streptococcus parauberis]|uniref:GNAT family acetyltransferase n=1 Tax=Streptococcus parauberis TaxID=1348 RepID=A0A0S3TG08_9STRE|nr:GNAT family N-acetyltransferase [Streptococcus parauberis]EMF49990.1 Unknown, probable lipopolysaccharide biosynthesis protein [Streptococcus parauberis KRS-02109]UWM86171.1 GNAT family N-acetyltransferase [Streptococcus parauberis]UWM88142.1 GNAT family N-acetyltransferase [Streptococcus parauberis]WEM58980.1 GNAT family N-acetyltransferase [Streptococcus parauberis]BAU04058.1 GNAT family acetyltransferase [Streptococcus parauberis]
MYLRKLDLADSKLMLEWMHDEDVTKDLFSNFKNKTIEDVENFITSSQVEDKNIHYAIANDSDEYMGTVSLKNVNRSDGSAEFAISVRKASMGHGYSWYGMKEILDLAFEKYDLDCVYWCVSRRNKRALRFYTKHNFHEVLDVPRDLVERYSSIDDLVWFSVLKGDVIDNRDSVSGCKVVRLNTISTLGAGELSFFEGKHDLPFDIKRIYFITKVPEGIRRGYHAHKNLEQLLFCPYGRIQLILEDENGREEIELSDPSIGVIIDKPIWREMLWLEKDSVLCVAASEYYDENDYIRDYNDFKEFISK